jgi:branched-chain amino acid transport system permease protein
VLLGLLGFPPSYWLGLIVNGLATGGAYALFAAGLTIIFGVVGILNFAQGEFFMVGGFIAFFISQQLGMGYWVSLVLTTIVMAGVGVGSYYGLFRRLQRSPRAVEVGLITTLGLSIVLQNGFTLLFGAIPRSPNNSLINDNIVVGGVDTSVLMLIALGIAIVALVGLHLFLKHTRLGLAVRGVPQNRELSSILGISSAKVTITALAVGMGLTGLAAAAIIPFYGVFPTMGVGFVFTGFAIVVIAGFGSIGGAITVAIIIGVVMSVAGGGFSASAQDAAPLVLMTAALLFRPNGIGAKAVRLQ